MNDNSSMQAVTTTAAKVRDEATRAQVACEQAFDIGYAQAWREAVATFRLLTAETAR